MAVGWAGDNAVQDQIQDSIADEVMAGQSLSAPGREPCLL